MSAIHPVVSVFDKFNGLSEKTIRDFQSIIHFAEYPKNTILLEIGKHARSLFFINNGLARAYYFHEDKEVTDYFAIDGQFIGAVPGLVTGRPSEKGIQLIENSQVYFFHSPDFEECCLKHHDLERAARRLMAFAMIEEQERIASLRFYTIKERYELMERKYPGITNRSPLQYIASYIGTTQVSISRIRAGIQ